MLRTKYLLLNPKRSLVQRQGFLVLSLRIVKRSQVVQACGTIRRLRRGERRPPDAAGKDLIGSFDWLFVELIPTPHLLRNDTAKDTPRPRT